MRSELILSALALLVVALGVGVYAWLRARAKRGLRRVQRAVEKLRHPVVLAHGLMGFDEVALGPIRQEYFRGVPGRLRELGHDVHVLKLPALGGVAARAEALAQAIRAIESERVHLIAHSMGGLDGRYALAKLGIAEKVATLITVGAPHRGTPLADLGAGFGQKLGLFALSRALSLDVGAFRDLTRPKLLRFNEEIPDAEGVRYASFIGAVSREQGGINPLLLPSWLYLWKTAGPNDGLVTADSQRWGEVLGTVEADHWAQIGWSLRFDAPSFYVSMIDWLRAQE
jgi:triacylglycerol lipase